ncbi:MAG: hypothetical protein WD078_04820 [Woeseia sp.]
MLQAKIAIPATTLALARSIAVAVTCLVSGLASAEPYLAVYKGMQCSGCHSHSAGGGMRNAYGNVFAQTELAARRIGADDAGLWTGAVSKWLSVGANLRADYRYSDVPDEDVRPEFGVRRATIYAEAQLIPGRLALYADQQIAPGSSLNREAYIRYTTADRRFGLMAGQFFLPYGLRLQDDAAFVRQVTGTNFTNPDRGVQAMWQTATWSTQLSLTNGSGGGTETDTGKQVSWLAQFVRDLWRVGASVNVNDSDSGERRMGNLFAGLRTGPVAWLAEIDLIRDDLPDGREQDGLAGYVEANWLYRQGHNLKFAYDYFDPDRDIDEDHRVRWSLLWEFAPIQFLQVRVGARVHDGPPQNRFANRDEFVAEAHGFF